ncbi:hypothetical protein TrVE_jg5463 [Triparma verrucosa]|uniref:Uncharacterized protein n=1 Tax=Triparma verrucosa TaxID=1606542 RepID=A0A9W7EMF0_9STRA|nr:hypothetical protein TrVE_jg5463 [Triparma verrucosa]
MAMNPTNDGGFLERMIRAKKAVSGAHGQGPPAPAAPPPLMGVFNPPGARDGAPPPLMPPPSMDGGQGAPPPLMPPPSMDGGQGAPPMSIPPPPSVPPPSGKVGDAGGKEEEKETEGSAKPSIASDGSFLQKMLQKAVEEKRAAEEAERKRQEAEERRAATVALDNARREQEAAERLQKSINKESALVENAFGDDSDSEDDEVAYDMATVRKTVAYIFEAKDWKGRLEKLKAKAKLDKRLGFIIDRACPEGKAFLSEIQLQEAERMTNLEEEAGEEGENRRRKRQKNN